MLTAEADKYGLHSKNRKEKMSVEQLQKRLKGLEVPYSDTATKKELLELLTNATPANYLVVTPDPLRANK